METQSPFFRKAKGIPVYYKVDPQRQIIESVKNWADKPKAIDHYPYLEHFVQNLFSGYKEIPERYFYAVREYVASFLATDMDLASFRREF